MNKLTFKKVWDESWELAFEAGALAEAEGIAVKGPDLSAVRDAEFEHWFKRHQAEEI